MAASFATVFFKLNLTPSSNFISDNLISIDSSRTSFKAEELNFFDPELPIEYGSKNLMRTDKNTIYRNIYLFIQRIADMANIKDDKIISYNLSLYLRGAVLE